MGWGGDGHRTQHSHVSPETPEREDAKVRRRESGTGEKVGQTHAERKCP